MAPVPGPNSQKRVFCRHQRQDNNKSRYFSCPGIFLTLTQLGRTHAPFVPDCRDWQSLNHSSLSLVHPPPFFLFLFLFSDFILFLYFLPPSVSRLDLPLCQTWLLFCQTCQIKGTMKLQQILNADEMACVQIGEVIRKGPQIPNHGWSRPWRDSIINIK